MSAAVVDVDGLTQAMLRGDGAHAASFDLASDKAYTVVTIGATHNDDSISAMVKRMGANPALSAVNSPLLPSYLDLAQRDGRQYLVNFANSLRAKPASEGSE